jgi:hypothetical protein
MSPVLDVILALVFIFTILSVTCTAIQESVAQLFNLRARTLRDGIRNQLLGIAGGQAEEVKSSKSKVESNGGRGEDLCDAFYRNPLVRSLYEKSAIAGWRRPSYIPARTFAAVVRELVDGSAQDKTVGFVERLESADLPPAFKRTLKTVLREVGNDSERINKALQDWFDDVMERVSAGYKRRAQLIGFCIALFVTVFANADAVRMTRELSSDASMREGLVAYAEAYAQQPYDTVLARASSEKLDAVVSRLESMSLPLGWPADTVARNGWQRMWNRGGSLEVGGLIGLLLTTFAVSLGAPFWFDLLNRFVNIRSAGKAPEEKPKSPEALPPPR